MLTASLSILPPQIHALVIKTNYQHAPCVGTALLAAYSNAQAGDCDGATNVFIKMAIQGMKPNEFTISSAIDACASQTAGVDQGRQFHAISIKYRYQDAICVSSALVRMCARKGSIDSARSVFERQTHRDLVSWNSMIPGYAQHGYSKKALDTFRQMEAVGIEMDGVTFLAVIMGCTHAGLVKEGQRYFDSMVRDHKISPTMEHYVCMVDLYSRAGKLDETMSLTGGMTFPAGATVWHTLLGACRVHKNVELGKLAAEKLLLLELLDSATYVLLSNIYAAAGKWKERDEVRKLMNSRKIVKNHQGRSDQHLCRELMSSCLWPDSYTTWDVPSDCQKPAGVWGLPYGYEDGVGDLRTGRSSCGTAAGSTTSILGPAPVVISGEWSRSRLTVDTVYSGNVILEQYHQ